MSSPYAMVHLNTLKLLILYVVSETLFPNFWKFQNSTLIKVILPKVFRNLKGYLLSILYHFNNLP